MSILNQIKAGNEAFNQTKAAGLRPETKELNLETMDANESAAIVKAFSGANDSIKVRRVLSQKDGRNFAVMIKAFHDNDSTTPFTYTMKGNEHQACRRAFFYETADGTKGFGFFPIPLALSEGLIQGSWINLDLHKITAGSPVLQADKEFTKVESVTYPVDTFYPAIGGGFNAFLTTATQLQAQLAHTEATITASRATAKAGA